MPQICCLRLSYTSSHKLNRPPVSAMLLASSRLVLHALLSLSCMEPVSSSAAVERAWAIVQGTAAQRLVGIDIAAPALARGSKRMAAALCPGEGAGEQPLGPDSRALTAGQPRTGLRLSCVPASAPPACGAGLAAAAGANDRACDGRPALKLPTPASLGPPDASAARPADTSMPFGMVSAWSSSMLLPPPSAQKGSSPALELLIGDVCNPALMQPGLRPLLSISCS